MAEILISGKAYASHEVEVLFLGRASQGVTELSWDSKQDSTDVYVIGNIDPVDSIESNRAHSGSITLLHDEFIGLELSAGGNILNMKPFDVTVVYKKAPFTKQTLHSFKPTGRAQEVKAGDNGALAWKIPGRFQAISAIKLL